MKTQTFSKATLILAASAAFMFSGCNTNEMGVDSHTVVSPQAVNKADTPKADATGNANIPTPAATQTTPAPTADATEDVVVSRISDALKAEYLDAINAARAETQDCGTEGVFDPASAMTWNDRLGNAAWEHSNDMAQSDTFSHTGSDTASDVTAQDQHLGHGSHFKDRIENQGYTEYRTIGENIAAGYLSAEEVIEGWIKSDHHCANLMNPKFTEVGMALVEKTGTDFGSYWSQELGGK